MSLENKSENPASTPERTQNKVLVVAAHPDDELLGCGGTILKHLDAGDEVHVLLFNTGRPMAKRFNFTRLHEVYTSLRVLNYPDQKYETKPLVDVIKEVEFSVKEKQPNVVYTHWDKDLNRDHRVVSEATMIACRPHKFSGRLLFFDIPGWHKEVFHPNYFVDVKDFLWDKSILLKEVYSSELQQPRTSEQIDARDANRNNREAFQLVHGLF